MNKQNSAETPNKKAISVQLIADALEMADDGWEQYLDTETGKIIRFPSCDNMYIERSPEDDALAEEVSWNERYVCLPNQRDLNEYAIMEDFAEAVPNPKKQEALFRALQMRRPFRHFKDELLYLRMEEEFYAFRTIVLFRKAKEWCEDHEIPCE